MTRNLAILGAALALAACKLQPIRDTCAGCGPGVSTQPSPASYASAPETPVAPRVHVGPGWSVSAVTAHTHPYGVRAIIQRHGAERDFGEWRCLFRDKAGVVIGTGGHVFQLAEGDAIREDADDDELSERPASVDCKAADYP